MVQNSSCLKLCDAEVPPEDAIFINDRIREDQAINWLVDGLPAAELKKDEKSDTIFYDIGFELGDDGDDERFPETPVLHNHYDILIE
jgi:transmembrane 9 superfamily member 2/4